MPKYKVVVFPQFDRQLRRCLKRGFPEAEFIKVITILSEKGRLPAKYRQHKLHGTYVGTWECHIRPDWLLVWRQNDQELCLLLLHTGTHADLFK